MGSASASSRRPDGAVVKWRLLLAFTGLLTMVLVAQDVPLVNYLRTVEGERLLASLERDREHEELVHDVTSSDQRER